MIAETVLKIAIIVINNNNNNNNIIIIIIVVILQLWSQRSLQRERKREKETMGGKRHIVSDMLIN